MTETTPTRVPPAQATFAQATWAEANQACLVAEFECLQARLSRQPTLVAEQALAEASAQLGAPSAIDHLTQLFGLSPFERQILLLCAGVEMDSRLATLCADSSGRPAATFALALAMLPEPHWSALTPARPLRRFRLVEVDPTHGLTAAPLRLDERVLHFLAGISALDQRLAALLQPSLAPYWIAAEHERTATHLARILQETAHDTPILHLCGDDPHGHEDLAALAAHATGRGLFVLRLENIPQPGPELDQFATLWEREAHLQPAALLLPCTQSGLTPAATHLIERLGGIVFLSSREPVRLQRAFLRFDVDKPEPTEQRRLWQQSLDAPETLEETIDDLSGQFRLSARSIAATGAALSAPGSPVLPEDLWQACRALARPRLEDLAQRIVPAVTWDDLILPAPQMQMLRHLAAQVRFRMRVYEHWGFAARGRRGLGISALFTGESGTGKTLAAEVLAAALRLDVYRIDLSAVVSKYIGETEKNLRQVFDTAEEGGVLLLFDEADALFGKRTEVKDSNNHFANIEVGYLLQRMEAYQGLAVLTTNLKSSMDKAFQRRLRFTIHFPFPDVAQREAIWSRAFPRETPTEGIDAKKLAQLNVPGGNIRNIALNAAFLAAQTDGPVQMSHLAEAAHLEAHKIERSLSAAELRGWV